MAPAVETVNPGASAVARVLHIEVDDAVSWSALLGALALELAGMAAMMRADSQNPLAAALSNTPAPAAELAQQTSDNDVMAPHAKRQPMIAGVALLDPPKPTTPASADTVGRYMLACLRKAQGEEAAGGAIYARYRRWCSEQQPPHAELEPKIFAQQFAQRCERLGIRTRRNGGKVYCLNVKLVT
jgi:hypothetical protein